MSQPSAPRDVASLVLGILSFHGLPCIGGVAAIALGLGRPSGLARAGVILGCVHLALCALTVLLVLTVGTVVLIANH